LLVGGELSALLQGARATQGAWLRGRGGGAHKRGGSRAAGFLRGFLPQPFASDLRCAFTREPPPAAEISQPNAPHKPLPEDAGENAVARLDKLRNAKGDLRTAEIRRSMQKVGAAALLAAA
jgi:hypothetical protein